MPAPNRQAYPTPPHQTSRTQSSPVNQVESTLPVFEYPVRMLHSIIQKRPANYMELQTIQNRIVVLENRTAELLQEKENKVLAAQFELKEARQQWCQTARRDSHTIADLMKDKEELTKAIERLRKDHESQAQCSRDQRAEHARQKEGWQRDRQKLESQVQSLINQHTTLVRGKDKKMDVMKEKCEEIDKSRHAEEIQKSNLLIQIKYLQGKVDKGEDLHMQNVSLQSEVASLTLDLEKQAAKLKSEEERLKSLVERSELEKDKTAKEIAGLNEKRKECLRREEALHTQVQALQGCLKDSDTEVKRLKEINNLLGTQAAEVEELNASLEIQVKTLAEEQLRSVEETQNAKRHSRHMGSQLKKLRQDFETYRKSHTQEHLAKLREAEESLSKYDELAASMQSLAEKRKVDNDSSERSPKRQRTDADGTPTEQILSSSIKVPLGTPPPPPPSNIPLASDTTPPPPPSPKFKSFGINTNRRATALQLK